jgi:hypothetical protein
MERCLSGRGTSARRRGRAGWSGTQGPWSRGRADADGPGRGEDGARPDCHSRGRIGTYRGDGIAPIFLDQFGRGVEPGNRQGHGFRGPSERRAARKHSDPTTRSGDRAPLRASTLSRALVGRLLRVRIPLSPAPCDHACGSQIQQKTHHTLSGLGVLCAGSRRQGGWARAISSTLLSWPYDNMRRPRRVGCKCAGVSKDRPLRKPAIEPQVPLLRDRH